MQIVIDIPNEEYKTLSELSEKEKVNELSYYERIIANGTPIPKGHGRLIDGDAIYKLFEQDNFIWEADSYILTVPTIIEADRGEEE